MNLIGAAAIVDGVGDLGETDALVDTALRQGLRVRGIHLAPLNMGWNTPMPEGFLRGACAPIEVIAGANTLLADGSADLIVIRGTDNVRSEFEGRRAERNRLMEVYGPGETFLAAYTLLGHAFLRQHAISEATFARCADALFENYWRTWRAQHPKAERPDSRWFEPVSALYRGVDCANPSVDFSGCLVVGSERAIAACGIDDARVVRVIGAQVEHAGDDGLESIEQIAGYDHLAAAVRKTCAQARIDLEEELLASHLLLEVYTCYPIVPIAFLLRTGLVRSADEVPEFLERHPITISGGLNLARAPWNNTTLRALIQMVHVLRTSAEPKIGMVHSIAALGYKQAVTILAPSGRAPA